VDIALRKQAEETLRQNEERYKLVLAGADAAIWGWDVPAKRVLFSPRWKELRGFSDDEVSDHEEEWSSGIHPDDFDRVMASVQAHFEGRTPVFAEEYRVRHKDGRWVWILDRGLALRDAAGQVLRMAGSETDITERK
jgi:PAS domain S-box-containing protein